MYTVLRFLNSGGDADGISHLREEAVARFGEDHVGQLKECKFACDVSDLPDWISHEEKIIAYITHNASWIRECRESKRDNGVDVCLDIAIEPEDMGAHAFLSISICMKLLRLLLDVGVEVEVTMYTGPS